MKKTLALIAWSLHIMASEPPQTVIQISEPTPDQPIINQYVITHEDQRHWFTEELQRRDRDFAESIRALKYRIDELEHNIHTINPRTKIAMAATLITSLLGAGSTLITYFTTEEAY